MGRAWYSVYRKGVIAMSVRSDRILAVITQLGMSYGELAKLTGIPKSALQRYATGETSNIPIDRIAKIAEATGTTAKYLMGWDTAQPDDKKSASVLSTAEALWAMVEGKLGRKPTEKELTVVKEIIDSVLKGFENGG